MADPIPTSREIVAYLNERFAARGLSITIDSIAVLPYTNPMWLANWDVPQLSAAPDREVIEQEIRDARWRFPQVYEEL